MALSTVFEAIRQLNKGMLKGAKELAKKEGMTGGETIFLMQTTNGKVLFDIADRKKLDETLVKVTGDIIQGIVLKYIPLVGWAIDLALYTSGNSLGNIFLDYYVGTKNTSFTQGYIHKKGGLMVNGTYMPGEYFKVGVVNGPDGRTKIYRNPQTSQFMSAEVISKEMYESVHPDGNDIYKAELNAWSRLDSTLNAFNPKHIVEDLDGVLKVTFPDGHIEAEDLQNVNNVIYGGDKNDTLIGNKGMDVLISGAGADHLEGGKNFDTYITNNNDTIKDNDGKGRVLFNGNLLSGGIWNKDKGVYEGDGGEYIQTSNGWKFVSSNAEVLNFNMDIKDSLGIKLKKDDEPPKDDEPILPEDFSSPLILDLNRDGKLSTTLFNSKAYFDMDSDGFREKTAWVQKGDGLLALDINGNGKIDNGSELFGNYTNLKDNTKAKDGFEALLQHDENHDGVIDKNDSIYSKLKVWLDENQNGKTDEGELKSLNEAGVTTVKLNPYQTLLSLLDDNSDGVLNDKDTIYSKIMVKTNEDGTKSLIIPTKKKKVALGITLQESADIEASVLNDDQALEAQEIMRFNVGLDRELLTGEEVVKLGYNRHNYRKNEIKKEVA